MITRVDEAPVCYLRLLQLKCMTAVAFTILCVNANALERYTLTELVDPFSPTHLTIGRDINNSGIVLADTQQAGWFLWNRGEVTHAESGSVYASLKINGSGQVSGYRAASSSSDGWIWTDGAYQRLEELPGGQYWNRPHGLADRGEAYGYSLGDEFSARPVKWLPDGSVQELGVSSEGINRFYTRDANDSGTVVGMAYDYTSGQRSDRAWMWKNGVTTFLPSPENSITRSSYANAVNNSGLVAGM